jgi:phosphoenolpyruvate carboxykinase (GTP)
MEMEELRHQRLKSWIEETASLCKPERIELCDGSPQSYRRICEALVKAGTLKRLNAEKKPGSYYAASDPSDVARVEDRTFICSARREEAGPTNNWAEPEAMRRELRGLFAGSMRGRTMYVIPYSMGPVGGAFSRIGVEISDSGYVAANMSIMARVGTGVLDALGETGDFVPCLHSVGSPREESCPDKPWPCDSERKYIVHFPEERSVWSYGSGYGGNALLGKKCFALRIASVIARDEGWLAEHMLILGITNPKGEKRYMAAAFPSACGKTNLAMLVPTLPGWKVECVGDDIAWMHFGADGRLYAINPEAGFFGVAPGTSEKSNPNAMRALGSNSIFTNCALTPDGDVWWEGIGYPLPEGSLDWRGHPYDSGKGESAAHPNARFSCPARQCPSIDPAWERPEGVPISAILFGGRRGSVLPLVHEARSWAHGVFLGSIVSSETTAAAAGQTGRLRRDPFAMLPFCGYNMGDYFAHWLSFGRKPGLKLPKIYYVNWFKKGSDGRYLWPGYGENSRVLAWIFGRSGEEPEAGAVETPIGALPRPQDLDLRGLSLSPEAQGSLFSVDREEWLAETVSIREHYANFGSRLPDELAQELAGLEGRLAEARR